MNIVHNIGMSWFAHVAGLRVAGMCLPGPASHPARLGRPQAPAGCAGPGRVPGGPGPAQDGQRPEPGGGSGAGVGRTRIGPGAACQYDSDSDHLELLELRPELGTPPAMT